MTFPATRTMVAEADLLLSILVPARAVETARSAVAEAVSCFTGSELVYADCNAVSPMTTGAGRVHRYPRWSKPTSTRPSSAVLLAGAPRHRFYASGARHRASRGA